MKKTNLINRVAIVTGIALSAFVLTAVAADNWITNTSVPPLNNTDAPLNVGLAAQAKTGLLGLKNFLFNPTGVSNIPLDSVLSATNADGTVGWRRPGAAPTLDKFTTSGSWTAPAGITRVRVRAWGAGGGGASRYNGTANGGPNPGGGGGSGGYVEALVPVTPGTQYTVTVGSGGGGGTSGTGTASDRCGSAGGNSFFYLNSTNYLFAGGGQGGNSNDSTCSGYLGGVGGDAGIVNPIGNIVGFEIDGGDGAKGIAGQPAEGGSAPLGGSGSSEDKTSDAHSPGGGGGGGLSSATAGRLGARGMVILEY
jgi:hypothetical protein